MRVVRLEIFGFKSFMDRTVLPVENGLTAVVGPNGCGKSNIVDALRWVMGETHAKNLRGGTLEDVIFNGTDKLRPLGLAEVSVTLRSSSEDFFSDVVSPDLEAELATEYALKEAEAEVRKTAKAADASITSAESGSGEESQEQASGEQLKNQAGQGSSSEERVQESPRPRFTVIQGNLDQATSSESANPSPEISKENSQENTEKNADEKTEHVVANESEDQEGANLGDPVNGDPVNGDPANGESVDDGSIATEAGAGVGAPSQDQALVVTASATLINRFSWLKSAGEVQVTRRLYRSGESEYFINRVPCRLKDVKELFRAVGIGARAHTLVAQGQVSRIVTAKPEERRLILEEAAGVLGFRDKIKAANKRLEETGINVSRLDDIIKEVTRQVNSLQRQASKAKNRESLRERLKELDFQLTQDSYFGLHRTAEEVKRELSEKEGSEEEIRARLQRAQADEDEARSHLMSIDVEGDELRSQIDAMREELTNRMRQRSERTSRINELKAFALSAETEITRLNERDKTLKERGENAQAEISSLETKLSEITAEIESLSTSDEEDLREVSAELEEAREELADKQKEMQKIREQLARSGGQLDAIRKQLVSSSPVSQLKALLDGQIQVDALTELVNGLKLFADGITAPRELLTALQAVLAERAGFLVAENPHEVAKKFVSEVLAKQSETTEGMGIGLLRAGSGSESSASAVPSSVQSFNLPRLIDQLTIESEFRLAAKECLGNVFIAQDVDQAISAIESLGESAPGDIVIVTKDGDLVRQNSFFSFRHEGGLIFLKSKARELEASCTELESALQNLSGQAERISSQAGQLKEQREDLLSRIRETQAKVKELSREQGNIRGRIESEKRGLERMDQDLEKVKEQVAEAKHRIQGFNEERQSVEDELKNLAQESDSEIHAELRSKQEDYAKLDEQRVEGREKLSDLASQVEGIRSELDEVRGAESEGQLKLQKVSLELEHLKERVVEEYGEEFWSSCVSTEQGDVQLDVQARANAKEEASKLKKRIAREGDVDPTSIARYSEEKERLEDLEIQRKDLDAAARTLKRTIERLRGTSEERFLSTFARVSKNFEEMVPRLFGGGKGSLELNDPSAPLDSGIQITARPPGKKLKSIDLLSGGEKALCATALIFSMFLVRPSPLCVLDEVDAPLDEANLVRFLTLVKEMSTKTQFLMITHNKNSMSTADHLIGVTMEEPGSSKILSVSLQEAYSQVA